MLIGDQVFATTFMLMRWVVANSRQSRGVALTRSNSVTSFALDQLLK